MTSAGTMPKSDDAASDPPRRMRIRQLVPNIHLGAQPTGPKNSLTDVPGVLAHTTSIHSDDGTVNTGVTVILPRPDWQQRASHAGIFRFNGAGEMTGTHCIEETGLLATPVVITNTFSVGDAYKGVLEYLVRKNGAQAVDDWVIPVVTETWDGWLSDMTRFAVTPQHVVDAIHAASADPVPEGNVGGGTGMMCHGFKGGTGSSSRVVSGRTTTPSGGAEQKSFTVGALVQANYGKIQHFSVAGVPVGRIIADERRKADEKLQREKEDEDNKRKDGSIIVVLATDAPLHPTQLQRLARRATAGIARVGGYGFNSSGDLFLAFSTTSHASANAHAAEEVPWGTPIVPGPATAFVDDFSIDGLFEAAADTTQEAVYNAVCMAETMVGYEGRKMEAIDLERLRQILKEHMVDV